MSQDLLHGLNQQQYTAVTYPQDHVLVLAGAGSGKTRVLTTRIAWLIQEQHLSPFAIMAVTFTNKAAREMLQRLSGLLQRNTQQMWVGTFHGICHRILRQHAILAGLKPTFQIMDQQEQLALVKRICRERNISPDFYKPSDLQSFINYAKDNGKRPADFANMDWKDTSFKAEFYSWYQARCEQEQVLDFAELLLRCYELLHTNESLRMHYQQHFQHILIDEFQDTNRLQYRWLQLLAGDQGLLFAVGDDDQSIYSFRGANVGNMRDFEQRYARGKVIRLEQNYRSTGHILKAANELIAHNQDRLGKDLWTNQGLGEPIRMAELDNPQMESQWVVDEIRHLIRQGVPLHEMAVLYRSNAQSRNLESELNHHNIAFRVYGGMRFYERAEIKNILAYLRLILSIDDNTAFLRVVNFPPRGIGARSLEILQDAAQTQQCSLAQAIHYVEPRIQNKLSAFVTLISELRAQATHLNLAGLIQLIQDQAGITAYYETEKDGFIRQENIDEMITDADYFNDEEGVLEVDEDQDGTNILIEYLTRTSLEAGEQQAQENDDAIQLMTVHAAKGLEFDYVFLTGLEDSLFPHLNSQDSLESIAEERRLMYVAMTRARRQLYITRARYRVLFGGKDGKPKQQSQTESRFLKEFSQDYCKWLTTREMSYRFADRFATPTPPPSTSKSVTAVKRGVEFRGQYYVAGQKVQHPRFGEGIILSVRANGENSLIAEIMFHSNGLKRLDLAVAQMTVLGT